MAVVCSANIFILAPVTNIPGFYWIWDKAQKRVKTQYYSSIDDYYEIPDGGIIDIWYSGSETEVDIFVKTSANSAFGNFPIDYVRLYSSSGDGFNKILSVTSTDYTITVKMYAITAKEITELTFDLPQIFDNQSPAELRPRCHNDYFLSEGTLITSYCNGVTYVEVRSDGIGGVTTETTGNSIVCGYVERLEPIIFTEEKTIDVVRGCFKNPVYLTWRNTLGGWDYWLFEWKQTEELSTRDIGEFFKNYSSLSQVNSFSTSIGKEAFPSILLFADMLNADRKRGISELLYSPKVYILNQDGSILNEVSVLSGTFKIIDNSEKTHSIEFQISLPEVNTNTN